LQRRIKAFGAALIAFEHRVAEVLRKRRNHSSLYKRGVCRLRFGEPIYLFSVCDRERSWKIRRR
jgi:hypothetical protein